MQKKIIALAIAGLSSAAFAQTNVTIQGLFDTGYQNFKQEGGNVTTKTNRWGSLSNTATTNLTFVVSEDLGSGMKAGLWLETDPAAGTNQAAFGGTSMWNSQNYLWVSGNFGKVSLGFMNNFALTTALTAQPFGIGMGGGYSREFGRLNGVGVIGAPANIANSQIAAGAGNGLTASSGGRDIRANNSIRYDSPSFSGFSAGFVYRSPNSGVNNNTADSDGQFQVGANYNNGPLNISATQSNIMTNINGLGAKTTTHNLLAANYTFGTFTLMAGWTSSKDNLPVKFADHRSWNLAAKWQATPTLAVMANTLKVDDKIAETAALGNQDRSLNALGLDYAMSKRTTAYARWEDGDNDKQSTTGNGTGKFTRWAFGLRHAF